MNDKKTHTTEELDEAIDIIRRLRDETKDKREHAAFAIALKFLIEKREAEKPFKL